MQFTNVRYLGEDFTFRNGTVTVENGVITDMTVQECTPDKLLLPGLIDLHFHGNSGADFSDGDYEGLLKIARFHAQNGVTAFSPATMTLPEEEIVAACRTAVQLRDEQPSDCSRILGITMEGPFFSEKKKGAQAGTHLRLPDMQMVKRLQEQADGMIRIVCVAPELEGAEAFIREASKDHVVSLAHTDADYPDAAAGFKFGARHVTHLFNAMKPFLHREPGLVGAAAERNDVTVEMIADGIHLHPATVRSAFKMFAGRVCLISDSMAACGLGDGPSRLGGQDVMVSGNRAQLADGTIAGSVTPLYKCMRNVIEYGISAEQAVYAASAVPAKVLGAYDQVGSIDIGKRADLLLTGLDYAIESVYIGGRQVR